MYDDVNISLPDIYFRLTLKLQNKVYNRMSTDTLTLSHIVRVRVVFHDEVSFLIWASPQVSRIGDAHRIRGS